MEIQVHVDQFLSLVRIALKLLLSLFFQSSLGGLFKNSVNFCLGFLIFCSLLPAKNLVKKYLCPSACDRSLALNLFVENLAVESAENMFFQGADERKIRLKKDVSGHQHCEEVIVVNFYQFLHQIELIADDAVLKQHNVVVRVHLAHKIPSSYHPHLP